jgi:hypothetical protein
MSYTDEHVGVVSGLADLINFISSMIIRVGCTIDSLPSAKVILFGSDLSLPDQLKHEFAQTLNAAFSRIELSTNSQNNEFHVTLDGFTVPPEKTTRRIVYGNSIHKAEHLNFYASLEPDEFVFFDNGLSSYASHAFDIATAFAQQHLPFPALACLSIGDNLTPPAYLSEIPKITVPFTVLGPVYARIRNTAATAQRLHTVPSTVLIGTSLFRTGKISWEEERCVYLKAVCALRARGIDDILFKSHPRDSSKPLLTLDDGVNLSNSSLPIEAFIDLNSPGTAYSISSTSLFTLRDYFGWQCFRLSAPAAQSLLDKSPHLRLTNTLPVADLSS